MDRRRVLSRIGPSYADTESGIGEQSDNLSAQSVKQLTQA